MTGLSDDPYSHGVRDTVFRSYSQNMPRAGTHLVQIDRLYAVSFRHQTGGGVPRAKQNKLALSVGAPHRDSK